MSGRTLDSGIRHAKSLDANDDLTKPGNLQLLNSFEFVPCKSIITNIPASYYSTLFDADTYEL